MRTAGLIWRWLLLLALAQGCTAVEVNLRTDASEPLEEYTLEGDADSKILLVPISGFIGNEPERTLWRSDPGLVQEVVSHLDLAAEDDEVKAVVLQIDSPGGSVTASDILYREIQSFKKHHGAPVVAMMMQLGTSGGYYAALAADKIMAHPTTITGSVGVLFIRPSLHGLMDKIGIEMEATKSGEYKDMGSPFRGSTADERRLLQNIVGEMQERFLGKVKERRSLEPRHLEDVARGSIYTAPQALERRLIDGIGYMDDAVDEAKKLARLPEDARLVVYRRKEYHNDNPYNPVTTRDHSGKPAMTDWRMSKFWTSLRPGFYYLWAPGWTR